MATEALDRLRSAYLDLCNHRFDRSYNADPFDADDEEEDGALSELLEHWVSLLENRFDTLFQHVDVISEPATEAPYWS